MINIIRERASWKTGEKKVPQYWLEEGGEMENTESTYENIKVTADDLKMNFVDFMLDEKLSDSDIVEKFKEFCNENDYRYEEGLSILKQVLCQ